MSLALYICLAGLALGIERVEFEVEIMFARLAGVDRTAKDLAFGWLHRCTFLGSRETLPPCRRDRFASAMPAWFSPSMSSEQLTVAKCVRGCRRAYKGRVSSMRLRFSARVHAQPCRTANPMSASLIRRLRSSEPALARHGKLHRIFVLFTTINQFDSADRLVETG